MKFLLPSIDGKKVKYVPLGRDQCRCPVTKTLRRVSANTVPHIPAAYWSGALVEVSADFASPNARQPRKTSDPPRRAVLPHPVELSPPQFLLSASSVSMPTSSKH